ncbi:diiron oxygenase [uncultured Bradyrhizobium sp.]|uniref:diiron oxygenase n=1 Tax=uncultured Bradyrhizobium sp. TaxID=199684 RepID=UPI0035C9FEA3
MSDAKFDTALLDRLKRLSTKGHYDPYTRFNWPAQIDRSVMWCDEDLLTTYGTAIHDGMSKEQIIALSQWECINFFSLNVHGIKDALKFVVRCMYEKRYVNITEYLHIFMAEENAHMWFFAKFCLDYADRIYPNVPLPHNSIENPIERDLYTFASTLIFEEYVDFYNHKVGENPSVPEIVREVNHQHHIDESRHISFGRDVVKILFNDLTASDPSGAAADRVQYMLSRIFQYFIGLMYNTRAYEDAGIVQSTGMPNAATLRNKLRKSPERVEYHEQWFKRTAIFFQRQGMLTDMSCLN